jgi:dTDP-4-amino-4,6-dideoxygalactose transaminase
VTKIYLSPPHMSPVERELLIDAFDSNWIAPLGPHVDAFEGEFCAATGAGFAAALSSGTAALHLSLVLAGVKAGDTVICPSLTFSASANPICYLGAKPIFIDSDYESWNMDPALLAQELDDLAIKNSLPAAVIVVHLYGQSADLDPILAICNKYSIPLIEDAAESLGGTYKGRATGTFGDYGFYSFNGNKIITTSGGGMLVSANKTAIQKARHLASQARDPAPHYQHSAIGYNYRLSNLLAAIGRGQLQQLNHRIRARRALFARYSSTLSDLEGLAFMPEPAWGKSNRWLTVCQIDPNVFGRDRENIRLQLEKQSIEARPVWKPMHMQPIFDQCRMVGGKVSEHLFENGLCLPSGSALTHQEQDQIIDVLRS